MTNKDLYEVIYKLVGKIEPEGDSSIDEGRQKNLEVMIDITENLIHDIVLVARHKYTKEYSMNRVGVTADSFITDLKDKLLNL